MTGHRGTSADRGSALIVVLVIVTLGSALVVVMLTNVDNATRAGASAAASINGDSIEESAIDVAIALIRADPAGACPVGTWTLVEVPSIDGASATVACRGVELGAGITPDTADPQPVDVLVGAQFVRPAPVAATGPTTTMAAPPIPVDGPAGTIALVRFGPPDDRTVAVLSRVHR